MDISLRATEEGKRNAKKDDKENGKPDEEGIRRWKYVKNNYGNGLD